MFNDEDGREREQVTSIARRIQDAEWLTEPSRTETHGALVIASSSPAKLCTPPRISRLTTRHTPETKCFTLTYRSIGQSTPTPQARTPARANEK